MSHKPTEHIATTISSEQLGLPRGTLQDLDAAIAQLPREQLAERVVSVLTGLAADRANLSRKLSHSLAHALRPHSEPLEQALANENAVFIEPMQQLVILRRCLTVCPQEGIDVRSKEGLGIYFDACRFASDVCEVTADEDSEPDNPAGWLTIAAVFLQRSALLNVESPTEWIARMRLMFRELPAADARAAGWVARLKARVVEVFGLTFDDLLLIVQLLGLWAMRFKSLKDMLDNPNALWINVDTWASQTNIPAEHLHAFFERTARATSEDLSDASLGGATSLLPFRDRPFLRFSNGAVLPISPAIVVEKLTYDFFWWTASPGTKQERPWQRDWGDLAELYVVRILAAIAEASGCEFKADIRWDGGQLDAAMWFKGHVALFEITAGMLTDAAAHNGQGEELEAGLKKTFVQSVKPDTSEKGEALVQLARDAKVLLEGGLGDSIPARSISRIYPVMIAIDRRVRTPALHFWFDKAFADKVADNPFNTDSLGSLSVLGLDDLETVEQLVQDGRSELRGTPPGLLRLLRLWDTRRDKLTNRRRRPAAWHHMLMVDVRPTTDNQRLAAEAAAWWDEARRIFPGREE